MNVHACFAFLAYYTFNIKDEEFYEITPSVMRGLAYAKHESSSIDSHKIYNLLRKTTVDDIDFHCGFIIGLCLRASNQVIKQTYKLLISNHSAEINSLIIFRNCIAIHSGITSDINLLNNVAYFNIADIRKKTMGWSYTSTNHNHNHICETHNILQDVVSLAQNNKRTNDDYAYQEISKLANIIVHCANQHVYHSQYSIRSVIGIYNMLSLTHFIGPKYKNILLLVDIITHLHNIDVHRFREDDSYKAFHYMGYMCPYEEPIYNKDIFIKNVIRNIKNEFFMYGENKKRLFILLFSAANIDERIYKRVCDVIQYDLFVNTYGVNEYVNVDEYVNVNVDEYVNVDDFLSTPPPLPSEQPANTEEIIDMDMNTGIFAIGVKTIDKMNTITMTVSNEDAEQMTKVILSLKGAVDKYKKYSSISWIGKIFTSALEVQANMTIAVLDFQNLMEKGGNLTVKLSKQYDSFYKLHEDLKELNENFNNDIINIDDILKDPSYSDSDKQRLLRRRNDLLAAQTLARTTALQYELAKNNIGILIDKFTAIEKILKPAIEMNMKLDDGQLNSVVKYF